MWRLEEPQKGLSPSLWIAQEKPPVATWPIGLQLFENFVKPCKVENVMWGLEEPHRALPDTPQAPAIQHGLSS